MSKKLNTNDEMTEFLLYTSPKGEIKVEVFLQNETIWLTQKRMEELFGVDRTVITKHLKNIFISKELDKKSVSAKNAHTAEDGKIYQTKFYNLDAILSIGYRVNSLKATQFRIWATKILKEYIIKGFSIDEDRLKNEQYFGKDYFRELLEKAISLIKKQKRRLLMNMKNLIKHRRLNLILTVKLKRF